MSTPFTITSEKTCGIYNINAETAKYILEHHNFDNRKVSNSHVNNIRCNVSEVGWLFDGQPITFNTQGNLTEGQHRLRVISQSKPDELFEVVVVTGAAPDSFSLTRASKPRKPFDEIYRKDNNATNDDVAVLNFICKHKVGYDNLNINNSVGYWTEWKEFISQGNQVSDVLLGSSQHNAFGSQRKALRAVATFACRYGYKTEAEALFQMVEDELVNDESRKLSSDILTQWERCAYMPTEAQLTYIFRLFCFALDRVRQREDGRIALEATLETYLMKEPKSFNAFIKS